MQTINHLKAEIERHNKIRQSPPKGKNGKILKSAVTRAKKRVEFLQQCIALLETKPNEASMIKQAENLKAQYDRMYENYFLSPNMGGG